MAEKQDQEFIDSNKEASDAKMTLENNSVLANDGKNKIAMTQLRLSETINDKDEWKRMFEIQNPVLFNKTKYKEQFKKEIKNNYEVYGKNMKSLKEANQDALEKLKNSLQLELNELHQNYQHQLEKMKNNCDIQLRQFSEQAINKKKEKNEEICRLSERMQEQCAIMFNEIFAIRKCVETSKLNNKLKEEKVMLLQTCVSKMDTLYQKSEEEYLNQIEVLKKELDLKVKNKIIQLQAKRAEIATESSIQKQKQVDDVVNKLEAKYAKMLENQDREEAECKKLNNEKIKYLKDLLEKNNITFKMI